MYSAFFFFLSLDVFLNYNIREISRIALQWGVIYNARERGREREREMRKDDRSRHDNQISFPGITFTWPLKFFYSCNSLHIGSEEEGWDRTAKRHFRARESALHK